MYVGIQNGNVMPVVLEMGPKGCYEDIFVDSDLELKGTVSGDFFNPVFYINQLLLVQLEMSQGCCLPFHQVIGFLK